MYDSYFCFCFENDFVKGFGLFKPTLSYRRKGRLLAQDQDVSLKELHDMCEHYRIALDKEICTYLLYLSEDLEWYAKTAPELEKKLKRRQELQEELSRNDKPLSDIIAVREALSELSLELTKTNEASRSVYYGILNDLCRLKKRLRKSRDYHIGRIKAFIDEAIGVNARLEEVLRPYLANADVNTDDMVDKEVFEEIILKDYGYLQVTDLLDIYLKA